MDVEAARLIGNGLSLIGTNLRYVGAGLAAIALAGVGAGIGNLFATFLASLTRNPRMEGKLFPAAMLGFALTEAVGLFALLIAFLILFT